LIGKYLRRKTVIFLKKFAQKNAHFAPQVFVFLPRCERANLLGVGKRSFVARFNGAAAKFFTEVCVVVKTRVKIEPGHLRVRGEG
jgi:hypothetical protein